MRLAKYLADAGLASRRASEEIVRAGRVTVDGTTIWDPAYGVGAGEAVAVDGRAIEVGSERVVYALNKPKGVLSTARDPRGRPTVVSLVPDDRRLYPVGRLDRETTGLILLTNDGELAHRLTHPRFEVEKSYLAVVANPPVRQRALAALRAGVKLDDGLTAPARVKRIKADTLELTIREGRKRQVRRMCERVGHPVTELQRIRLGPLTLGGLSPGSHRRLSEEEVSRLASAGTAARRPAAGSSAGRGGRRAESSV